MNRKRFRSAAWMLFFFFFFFFFFFLTFLLRFFRFAGKPKFFAFQAAKKLVVWHQFVSKAWLSRVSSCHVFGFVLFSILLPPNHSIWSFSDHPLPFTVKALLTYERLSWTSTVSRKAKANLHRSRYPHRLESPNSCPRIATASLSHASPPGRFSPK